MRNVPVVPAALFSAGTNVLDKLGFSSERIVERAGLPQYQYLPPQAKLPGAHLYRLLGHTGRAIGPQNLFLKVPDLAPFTSLPGFGRMISGTPNVYSAIKRCNRLYRKASSVARFWTREHDHGIWWVRESNLPPGVGSRQMELYSFAYMLQVVRLGAGDGWRPARVCVERESIPRLDRLEPLAGAEVLRNAGVSAVWIPRPILPRPMSCSATGPVDLDRFFADAPSEEFVGSLLQTLRSLVKLGHPRIETVAEIGGVSVRTLQRRLKAEDLTFKALVDQARFLEARDLLEEDVPLVEIAQDLSYSDQAHFNRAFHRWAGVSPSRYRSQLLSG